MHLKMSIILIQMGGNANVVCDPLRKNVSTAKDMPTPRKYFGVAVVNDILYVIGGKSEEKDSSLNQQYIPIGYHGTLPSTDASFKPFLIFVALILIISIVVHRLFFYHKKRKKQIETILRRI